MKNDKKPLVFAGINWSTRVKSLWFWTGLVGILGGAVVSIGNLIGLDLSQNVSVISEQANSIIQLVFYALGLLGVTVDANTKGFGDSQIVKTDYTKPRDSQDPNEQVDWNANVQQELQQQKEDLRVVQPKQYDTNEPFTQDDTVGFDDRIYTDVPTGDKEEK